MAPDAVIQKFREHFPDEAAVRYAKGEVLVSPGESKDKAFFVVSGRIKGYELSYRGDEVVVSIISPPAFFPLSWAVQQIPNRFYYKAETDCDVYVVDSEEVLAFIQENPDVMFNQLRRLYGAINGLLGRMVHMMSGTAKSRLLYELIAEGRAFGQSDSAGAIRIDSTERDLAARAGLTRETVSREMAKLKKQGWVAVNGKGIQILDMQQLERALGVETEHIK